VYTFYYSNKYKTALLFIRIFWGQVLLVYIGENLHIFFIMNKYLFFSHNLIEKMLLYTIEISDLQNNVTSYCDIVVI